MVFRLIVAASTLTFTTTMAASSDLHGARYKLLHQESKSGKAKSSKGKSSKSAGDPPSSIDAVVYRPHETSKSSKTMAEMPLLPLDHVPSSSPSTMVAMTTAMPSSSSPAGVVDDTISPTALLATTPTHRPYHDDILSPHGHDVETEPSSSPMTGHNLFTPSVVDHHHVDTSSFAPSTKDEVATTASPAPSSTIQSSTSPPTNMPSIEPFIMGPTVPPVVEGLFGPSVQEESFITAAPTLSDEDDTGMDWPSFTPSSSPFVTAPTSSNEGSFSITVALSSKTSFAPSSTPSSPTSTAAPTTSKELNLLDPSAQETQSAQQLQGAASLMVIFACALAIMGTLFGVFKVMKKDEDRVLDEYGAQLAGAAAFDADEIGEVNVEGGDGGVDSHLQLVTD